VSGPGWRPTASRDALRRRAELASRVRAFFAGRGVLEVWTPCLGEHCAPDPGLSIVEARLPEDPQRRLFLQPSPEAAMKRLLAAGSGPIYQLAPAFRSGEAGRRHNPEFTMLEWYRPGFSLTQLIAEVDALLAETLAVGPGRLRGYREVFESATGLDPLAADDAALRSAAAEAGAHRARELDRDALLDLLFTHRVEPLLGQGVVHVVDFPASQAAMARVEGEVCRRVETFVDGIELANGYEELTSAAEQRARFERAARERAARDVPALPVDEALLAALEHGLPASSGIALGFDRLVMRALGSDDIAEVLAFPLRTA
jgi:lysyl-tRNA synthetase class 2